MKEDQPSSAVPDVKEEEWDYREILGIFHVTRDGHTVFVVENQRAAVEAKDAHNASIQRVLEKTSTLSDNVKAQPDQGEIHETVAEIYRRINSGQRNITDIIRKLVENKEAVADSVEAQGQNELLPCPFCGNRKVTLLLPTCRPETPYNAADRLYPVVRCSQCYADVPGNNEDYEGRSAITRWNKRAAISVSDGGGSDASRVSLAEEAKYPGSSRRADSSSSANAQGPMEERYREALEQITKGEGRYSRDPLTHAANTIEDMISIATNTLAPSLIKEQPAKKADLEGLKRANRNLYIESNERKLVIDQIAKCLSDYQYRGMPVESFINTVATVLEPHTRFVDYLAVKALEEKEAVTRNTAVLRIALENIRDFVSELPAKIDSAQQNECICGTIQAEHGCPWCSAMSALYREIEKVENAASVVLDGQPEGASGGQS